MSEWRDTPAKDLDKDLVKDRATEAVKAQRHVRPIGA
jgi:hypothetical protein